MSTFFKEISRKEDLLKNLRKNSHRGRKTNKKAHCHRNRRESLKNKRLQDFPGGPLPKTPCSQCRGPGFDPWPGN